MATTRLILTHGGDRGTDAAGGVIRAFGEFVAGDQVVVGAILFALSRGGKEIDEHLRDDAEKPAAAR